MDAAILKELMALRESWEKIAKLLETVFDRAMKRGIL